ncbi:Phage tail fiber repeat [Escherichia coli]|nr:Phage tail fiber repeat [Escherichia coli]
MALEDASTTKKGIVQLSSATNSTSETLAATPKAVKSAYDNAEKRLQKDQNGADIPDKGCFLNNINAVSKTDFADKRGMRYVRVNAPAGATSGKYYPVVVMRSAGSVSELASRVIITTATRTAGDPMNNCEFNGFVMPGGWTDRGRYAYGMFWQYQNNERAIHSIMMSNKGDDLRSVFYVDGAAFPVFAFIEDGLSISAPGADLVVNDTTYKFGATNPAGFAPIFPDICYHLTHYKPAAADIPVASDNPAHYADAIRYNARTPLQGSLLPLTRLVWA